MLKKENLLFFTRNTAGTIPPDFNENTGDVNKDENINLADALMAAREFVGLIDEFPGG